MNNKSNSNRDKINGWCMSDAWWVSGYLLLVKYLELNIINLLIKIQSIRMTLLVARPRPPSVFYSSFVLSVSALDA